MFLRIDKLPVQLPASPQVDPIAAKNVQELLGGRFGEMSTLMNYTFQSFAMRGRDAIRPYYALISNIAAEEGGHIEIVSAAINSCLNGPRTLEHRCRLSRPAGASDFVLSETKKLFVREFPVSVVRNGWSTIYAPHLRANRSPSDVLNSAAPELPHPWSSIQPGRLRYS
jgi:Mn-containing catalase